MLAERLQPQVDVDDYTATPQKVPSRSKRRSVRSDRGDGFDQVLFGSIWMRIAARAKLMTPTAVEAATRKDFAGFHFVIAGSPLPSESTSRTQQHSELLRLSAPHLIVITATVAILCLNEQFAGVPPQSAPLPMGI